MSNIIVIGTLDTKGAEISFIQERLAALGKKTLVMDVGVMGTPSIDANVSRSEVAKAAGSSIAALIEAGDRGQAIDTMMKGAVASIRNLQETGQVRGVLAIGGSAGTSIATAAMRALPVGLPKLMVSTMASGDVSPYVGTKDITMMYSVVDFTGLNRISRPILANAAGAIAGMVDQEPADTSDTEDRPLIAATMFGVTTPCVERVRTLLDEAGYELLVFHATGAGGRAMEELIAEGLIDGVMDITTTELADELVGGVLSAGPDRMEIAGKLGIPQVISLGALDMVNFGAPDTIPAKFSKRSFYQHNPTVTLMRTTAEECEELGKIIARKANAATGPVTIVMPLGGVSAIDKSGEVFFDGQADEALFDAVRNGVAENVVLKEMSEHINDEKFARQLVDSFLAMPLRVQPS